MGEQGEKREIREGEKGGDRENVETGELVKEGRVKMWKRRMRRGGI